MCNCRPPLLAKSMLILFLLLIPSLASYATDPNSVEWVCENQSERVRALLDALDLDRAGLEGVKTAADTGNFVAAGHALLEYYRDGSTAAWLRDPTKGSADTRQADAVLADTFTFYEITGTVPRTAEGGIDWTYRGPNNDHEWCLALNRHIYLDALVNAWLATGDTKYVDRYDALVRDWILNNPYPARENVSLAWRGLEAHFRAVHWARGFYALQHEPALTPATRLLLLTSLPDHAHYLKSFHKPSSNWIVMELYGLATIGACWPEFRDAPAWMEYAAATLTRQLTEQVYPDGAQIELTSSYHRLTANNFERFADLARLSGKQLPHEFLDTTERMWDYLAGTMRPDGYSPLNNDSDRDHLSTTLADKARQRGREDWAFIASNGSAGVAPAGPPSRFFPWAGHAVMRSGWDRDAQWSFFDIGPLGSGHYHHDKLHLSIAAGGRDLLVDGGRYTYVDGPWRRYFTGSASHNVLLIDGRGQAMSPKTTSAPLDDHFVSTDLYDGAWGTFDSGYLDTADPIQHTRMVIYLRGRYWIVIDHVDTSAPHTIQALWHFHPDCTVQLEDLAATTVDAGVTNLTIQPSSDLAWTVSTVRGREDPAIQGWWSREYNVKEPATAVIYETPVERSATWAWLIVPHREMPDIPAVDLAQPSPGRLVVHVDQAGERQSITVTLPPAFEISLK